MAWLTREMQGIFLDDSLVKYVSELSSLKICLTKLKNKKLAYYMLNIFVMPQIRGN